MVLLLLAAPLPIRAANLSETSVATVQHARQQLFEVRRDLRKLVSECNGGDILVRACPGRVPPAQQACNEPIARCPIVAALRATEAALGALQAATSR